MAEFWGMQTEHVEQHGELHVSSADLLEELGQRTSKSADAVTWIGPDADAFRDQVRNVVAELSAWNDRCRDLRTALREDVSQQESASSPDGSAGGSAAGGAMGALLGGGSIGAVVGGLVGAAGDTVLGGGAVSSIGPRLGEKLGTSDNPDDDIAPLTADDVTRPEKATDPSSIGEMLDNLDDVAKAQDENSSSIRIQQIEGADGQTRYIVYVPGSHGATQNVLGGPDATGNPNDWNQNPGALRGDETDSSQSIIAAMNAAGIPHGADVSLVGHSQGGIAANNLAADPSVNGASDGWNISNVVSVGSPVENADVPGSTATINFAHEGGGGDTYHPGLAAIGLPMNPNSKQGNVVGDVVPGLDGNPHIFGSSPAHRHEVDLAAPTNNPATNHDIGEYQKSINSATGQQRTTIEAVETNPSMSQILKDGRVVDTVDVSVSRADGTYGDQRPISEYYSPFNNPTPGIG